MSKSIVIGLLESTLLCKRCMPNDIFVIMKLLVVSNKPEIFILKLKPDIYDLTVEGEYSFFDKNAIKFIKSDSGTGHFCSTLISHLNDSNALTALS